MVPLAPLDPLLIHTCKHHHRSCLYLSASLCILMSLSMLGLRLFNRLRPFVHVDRLHRYQGYWVNTWQGQMNINVFTSSNNGQQAFMKSAEHLKEFRSSGYFRTINYISTFIVPLNMNLLSIVCGYFLSGPFENLAQWLFRFFFKRIALIT